ncbi:hypothetical protein LTR53_019806, partial [Teratosphaeriaceae sp. CCFEE 6253]
MAYTSSIFEHHHRIYIQYPVVRPDLKNHYIILPVEKAETRYKPGPLVRDKDVTRNSEPDRADLHMFSLSDASPVKAADWLTK